MNLDAIGLACRNLESSILFYQQLGFVFEKFGPQHYEGKSKNGTRLMLDDIKLLKQLYPDRKEGHSHSVSLCFAKKTPEEVDELFENLLDSGGKSLRKPWDAFWGQRYCSIEDPDGNQIDIFANKENSQ